MNFLLIHTQSICVALARMRARWWSLSRFGPMRMSWACVSFPLKKRIIKFKLYSL
jgi:hypothetical protein